MSVLMTLRVAGDPILLEKWAAQEQPTMQKIVQRAKEHGLISHQFYGNVGHILVVDEWPDQVSFQTFFDSSPEIGEMMASVGVTTDPEITFWRKLDTGDAVG